MTQQIENFLTRIEQAVSQISLPLVDVGRNLQKEATTLFNWIKLFAIFMVIALIIIIVFLILIWRKL